MASTSGNGIPPPTAATNSGTHPRGSNHRMPRPISIFFPLRPPSAPYRQGVESFFENLLPDSRAIRERIQRRFNTRSATAFDLLSQIGRDCVGALQLLPEGVEPGDHPPDHRASIVPRGHRQTPFQHTRRPGRGFGPRRGFLPDLHRRCSGEDSPPVAPEGLASPHGDHAHHPPPQAPDRHHAGRCRPLDFGGERMGCAPRS
jgi:HipA-like protein